MTGGCPDLAEMAAYADGLARGREVERIEEHLVSCDACGGLLAEFARSSREGAPDFAGVPVVVRRGWLPRALTAAAACAALAGGLLWVSYPGGARAGESRDAVLVRGGGTLPLSAGERLLPGDEVGTGPAGMCDLSLSDGAQARVGRNSRLVLLEPEDGERVRLRLEGAAFFQVPRAGDRFRVCTVLGDVIVRGTGFIVTTGALDASGEPIRFLRVETTEGVVEVRPGLGESSPVPAGHVAAVVEGLPAYAAIRRVLPTPGVAEGAVGVLASALSAGEDARRAALVEIVRFGPSSVAALRAAARDAGEDAREALSGLADLWAEAP